MSVHHHIKQTKMGIESQNLDRSKTLFANSQNPNMCVYVCVCVGGVGGGWELTTKHLKEV